MELVNRVKTFVIKQPMAVLGIVGFVLGVLIATEYSARIPRIINPVISSYALDEMEKKLENEQNTMKEQHEAVDNEVAYLQGNLKNKQGGLTSLVSEVELLKEQSGLTARSGDGIEIILDDSDKNDENANAIAHASDLRDLVDYMWTRGAQAISIEASGSVDERVIFTTAIDCIVNTVLINNTKSSPPFKIKVLGNRDALVAAINDHTNLKSIYDRVESEGLIFYVTDNIKISIPKYSGNLNLENAKVQ
jgi:uncharacterized protein YlxW (UPF0749 family)